MNISRTIAAATLILCAIEARAAQVASNEKITRELPILLGGSLVIANPVGDVDVIGTDDTKVVLVVEKIVRALDKTALDEGKDQTQLALLGDARIRRVRTIVPPIHSSRWTSGMRYVVRVPRTINVSVTSSEMGRIRVLDMRGNVSVKCFNGAVVLERLTGSVTVDSANSNILFIAPDRGLADTQLSSVNGNIEVRVPVGARFRWLAETIKGDARTTLPVRGAFIGTHFRANVNGDGGPLVTTQSFNGNIFVLQSGTQAAAARSVRAIGPEADMPTGVQASEMRTIQRISVHGFFRYATTLGNVLIGEVHGSADIATGAGEVQLGAVFGNCQVVSGGGPLNLGQITGALSARTEAGDVIVDAARSGGTIITGGGTIRLLFNGGDTRLQSGGGDIFVRQSAGGINAETQSGDITITIDPSSKSEKVTAKTAKGNVILNVMPAFSADIDATVITSDPEMNNIISDLTGLQVRREQIGGKTKIRATGKVNGGGDRVELYAVDGGIQISTRAGNPATP